MSMRERLIWGLGANVLLAVTPMAFNAFSGAGVGWLAATRHGEILIVAVGIAGLSLATAGSSDPRSSGLRELRAVVMVGGLAFVLAAGLIYADNFRAVADGKSTAIQAGSGTFLLLSMLLSFVSTFLDFRIDEEYN